MPIAGPALAATPSARRAVDHATGCPTMGRTEHQHQGYGDQAHCEPRSVTIHVERHGITAVIGTLYFHPIAVAPDAVDREIACLAVNLDLNVSIGPNQFPAPNLDRVAILVGARPREGSRRHYGDRNHQKPLQG